LKEILDNIRIVPLEKTLVSEGVIHSQAQKLANFMEHDGTQRDPIIVAKEGDQYIVLDGMHRMEALKIMGCRDILAYVVNYNNHRILLESWDALIYDFPGVLDVMTSVFEGTDYVINQLESGCGREEVMKRRAIFSVVEKNGKAYTLTNSGKDKELSLDELINVLVKFEKGLDDKGAKIRYVANTVSEVQFEESKKCSLVIRTCFTKKEVVERTLQGKLFPRKTTRHAIYERPLRVGVDLSILKQEVDPEVKNRLLQAELLWRHEHGRIRYYPEPVFLFDD
jgi:hypothetical protein